MAPRGKKQNNYAFIDSQNLNLGTQRMGWKMDWRKFREYLRKEYGVSRAYMFIGYMSENEQLYEYMHNLGYLVVLKPTVDVVAPDANKDDKEKPAVKGNVDADLVLYAMKELPNYDNAVIVSGDGDFLGLIEYLEEQGKLEHILTPNWQYSSLFKPFEPKIFRLDQKRKQLTYHDRKKKKKSKKSDAQ
ncbi:MAG TPA: NYN domain-containing protein [Candidatus Saccharimonadales bacterium]|nr:NYN domain-containing protein [Candidatus Saccharimonadales bacterium]